MSGAGVVARPLTAFAGKFLALYLLLALPWTFLTESYRNLGDKLGQGLFDSQNSSREISFAMGKNPKRPFDARITIVNPKLLNPNGSGPVRNLDFDTKALFWNPCVLLIALIFATPVSWKRRWHSLAISLPLLMAMIFCFLNFCRWDEASEIALVVLTPFWKTIVTMTRQALVAYLGLVTPVLLWLVTIFRREDLGYFQKMLALKICP